MQVSVSTDYRREIDGLRAVAVLPVILFHADFALFSGGYVGVDVFFVISGYLITSILIKEMAADRFSLLRFYERRARRILPALFVVMAACIPFAWLLMLPQEFKDFSQSLVVVTLFSSNIFFCLRSGYFDPAAEEMPLLHTWSLAVEEQYYLVFPLLLLALWRFGRRPVFYVIVVMAATSLLLSEWGWRIDREATFYLAPTRAWELLAGSLCAMIGRQRSSDLLAAAGLAMIVGSIFLFDATTPFPSLYALVPVVGTVLIILYGGTGTLTAGLLSHRAIVGIGLISYSGYLWHQPLFAFARIHSVYVPSATTMLMLSALSLLLAYFSWAYIEQPFRRRPVPLLRRQGSVFAASGVAGVLIMAVGLWGHVTNGREALWLAAADPDLQATYEIYMTAQTTWVAVDDEDCLFRTTDLGPAIAERLRDCYGRYGPGVLLLGDSHARDLFGITTNSRHPERFIVAVAEGGCRAHTPSPQCHYDDVRDLLAKNNDVFDVVIYHQAGFYLLSPDGEREGSRRMFEQLRLDQAVPDMQVNVGHVERVHDYLLELNHHADIVWLGSRVEPHIPMDYVLAAGCEADYRLRGNQRRVFKHLDHYLETRLSESPIRFMSFERFFHIRFDEDFLNCEELYWRDGHHLSVAGQIRLGQRRDLISHVRRQS